MEQDRMSSDLYHTRRRINGFSLVFLGYQFTWHLWLPLPVYVQYLVLDTIFLQVLVRYPGIN